MVALKLKQFGGMIPAVDQRLLPDNQASSSENTWLYSGTLDGIRTAVPVHVISVPTYTKAFRIPGLYVDKDHIEDSAWINFRDPDTDVVTSPTVDDTFNRFYWTSPTTTPVYNTKDRIVAGNTGANAPLTLGIPTPTEAPLISRVNSTYYFVAGSFKYDLQAGVSRLYETVAYGVDEESFFSGLIDAVDFALFGATKPLLTSGSQTTNIDKSPPVQSGTPVNEYLTTGHSAELRYGTTASGQRITVSDSGGLTIGVPPDVATDPVYKGIGVLETRAYVYTWVSLYGEEGPPSPPTLCTGWSGDPWHIRVTAPSTDDKAGRKLDKVRIYRTVSGVAGTTVYFQVAEIDILETSYEDLKTDDDVSSNAVLQSDLWTAPPDDLDGFAVMPNGIIAGFRANEVWFCEPYRPHAWPPNYSLSFDTDVVGLGVVGQTLMVLTQGSPYAVTGINPAQMAVSRLKKTEPCLSRGSIVSTTNGVIYASPNGLAVATPGDVAIVSRDAFTKDAWLDFVDVPSLRACQLGGAYYAWGSVKPGCFDLSGFEPSAFLQIDYSGSYSGILYDFTNPRVGVNKLTSTYPIYNAYTDAWTGEIFLVYANRVRWLDLSTNSVQGPYKWRSKLFEMPNKRNLEAMRIWFTINYPVPKPPTPPPYVPTDAEAALGDDLGFSIAFTDDSLAWRVVPEPTPVVNPDPPLTKYELGIVRVYADDRLVLRREMKSSGELMRLPSGFRATWWQIEIEARVQVNNIEIATTAKELMSV